MSHAPWFVRFGERTHPLLLPVCVFICCFLPFQLLETSDSLFTGTYGMSDRRLLGTSLLFCILPAYALLAQFYAWRVARRSVEEFEPLIPAHALPFAMAATTWPGWWMVPVIVVGAISGSHDFSPLSWLSNLNNETVFDLWFRFSATLAWAFVFWMLCWRLRCSWAMYRLGTQLNIDVYKFHGLDAFVRLPLTHLLIVMGALALLPLQSLDFELRWINYRSGLFVGLPALILLVLPPIWGLHQNMRDRIAERIAELQDEVNRLDRSDFSQLALLIEHRETVRSFRSWPLDVALVGKLLFYLFIPPMAWVAAALVERAVDNFV